MSRRRRAIRFGIRFGIRSGIVLGLGLVLGAAPAPAEDAKRPTIVITDPYARAYQAAIQRFWEPGPSKASALLDGLRREIGEALEFSNVFTPIDPTAYLGPDMSQPLEARAPPNCSDWRAVGADALIEGEVHESNGRLLVEYRAWDTIRCRSLLRKRYRGGLTDRGTIARRIADDIVYEFTGTRGVASTEIAFISDRTGQREVYVADAMGGNLRTATRNRSINAFPSWAPSGNELLYTSYRRQGQPGLFLLTRGQGTPGQLLTRVDEGIPIYRGVFDPDGDRLAVVMSLDGATNLFLATRDGKKPRQLTYGRSIDISPSWSPDGERLAFVSDRSGSPQVYVMERDGTKVRRLTFEGAYNTAPAWSPDGRWIAYEMRMGGQFDIWLIDPEGKVNVPLVSHARSDEGPTWAPDSRSLAFSSTRRGRADIYQIGVDGRNLRRLTKDAGDNISPAWGPFPQ